jgi:hypothetical protein
LKTTILLSTWHLLKHDNLPNLGQAIIKLMKAESAFNELRLAKRA